MKKLQNNFTTPEQSKRLLDIGIPADSADCEYICENDKQVYVLNMPFSELKAQLGNNNILPCWSVGRLIEIYELCSGEIYERKPARLVREGNVSVMKELTIIEDVIGDIINARLYIYPHIDFSKLEE